MKLIAFELHFADTPSDNDVDLILSEFHNEVRRFEQIKIKNDYTRVFCIHENNSYEQICEEFCERVDDKLFCLCIRKRFVSYKVCMTVC